VLRTRAASVFVLPFSGIRKPLSRDLGLSAASVCDAAFLFHGGTGKKAV
jgi:hypothetical protein